MRGLAGALAVSAVLAVACGSTRDEIQGAASSPTAAPISKTTLVASGIGDTIVLDSTGAQVADLGDVIGTPRWTRAYAVDIDAAGNTTLRAVDGQTGATSAKTALAGRWRTVASYASGPSGSAGPSGFSPGGRWLALEDAAWPDRTSFLIVDTTGGAQPKRIDAPGMFFFDAMSENGESLYLVQHLLGTQYKVRVVDVRSGLLLPDAVVDVKQLASTADANGVMSGTYTSSTPGPQGQWFFSVYQHPTKGPYIHALNTTSRIAECILDLPTFGKAGAIEMAKQPFWSLALGKQQPLTGSRLYAVNGALGEVALIDPDGIKVRATQSFKVPSPSTSPAPFAPRPGAVVSPDGYRLYAIGEHGIFVLDAMDLSLRATFQQSASFRSLAVAPDNATLFALEADGMTIDALEARTGRPLATLPLRAAAESIAIQGR
jgi:hypothetical protein